MVVTRPRIRMIIPIWGDDYIERWLALSFASLRANGNIPYLNERSDFELALATKSRDAEQLRNDPRFAAMTHGLRVVFVPIDQFFPPRGQVSYGVPLALAYGKAIADLGVEGLGSFIIIMTADMILSAGSLKSLFDRLEEGYDIVTAPSIRVVDAETRPLLLDRVDGQTGVMTMTSRQMMRIINAHLHSTVRARTVNEAEFIDSTYYHNIYWRVSPDCLVACYFLLMPLCFRVQRQMTKVLCPIDYGFIMEICPDGRFTVLGDSDEMVMLELQERDSQAYLLRIAPPARTLEERLARLEREIATTTGGWATAEHRRSANRLLYFHERDLPSDIAARTARFELFIRNIFAQMPPPASHIRHFHWLGDVRNYRSWMVWGGVTEPVALLDDSRNATRPTGEELSTRSQWAGGPMRRLLRYALEEAMLRSSRLRGWGRHITSRFVRRGRREGRTISGILYWFEQRAMQKRALRKSLPQLGARIVSVLGGNTHRLVVACFAGYEEHIPPLPAPNVLRLIIPKSAERNAGIRLSPEIFDAGPDGGTLLVVTPIGLLGEWGDFSDDVARALAHFKQVIFALVQPYFALARMQDFSWVLSFLVGAFVPGSIDIRVEGVPLAADRHPAARLLRLCFPSFWLRLPRQLVRYAGALLRQGLSYPLSDADAGPQRFSVLLVDLARRRLDQITVAQTAAHVAEFRGGPNNDVGMRLDRPRTTPE
jgi:hypothetical protein